MRSLIICAFLGASLPAISFAQDAGKSGVEVRKQTADTASQTVVETPATRATEKQQHITDAMNTKKGAHDPRKRDAYGTPVPSGIKGQGTNSSTDAMRAADEKH